MCILCTITSHSTHAACPCAVDLCTRPFALESCLWLPVSLEASAFDSQTVATDHQGALPHLARTKVLPSQHSCSSETTLCQLNTRHCYIFQSFIAWCFISVGDLNKVNHWDMPTHIFSSFQWADLKDVSSTNVSIFVMGVSTCRWG